MEVIGYEREKVLFVRRWRGNDEVFTVFHLGNSHVSVALPIIREGRWSKALDSAEQRWKGNGSAVPDKVNAQGEVTLTLGPKTFVLFVRTGET